MHMLGKCATTKLHSKSPDITGSFLLLGEEVIILKDEKKYITVLVRF